MKWWSRIFNPSAVKAAEGEFRPGPYLMEGGYLPNGAPWNYFQMGMTPSSVSYDSFAIVEACISSYAQTVAMCPPGHYRVDSGGEKQLVETSSLSRVLKSPNDYESTSDFLLNLIWSVYEKGNAYAYAIRNERNEIVALHRMNLGTPRIGTDGSIYYSLGGNEIVQKRFDFSIPVPARDVLHLRLNAKRHPLKGVSPLLSTALDLASKGSIANQQLAFYKNQARPIVYLESDERLTAEQTKDLRARWQEQRSNIDGGPPILSWGLKAKSLTPTASDSQIAELLKMTDQNVALAFRVPLPILGISTGLVSSTETLMQQWIASGLGFILNHLEESLGKLFKLNGYPNEYIELDTRALLRSSYKDRIEGLARGVQGGIYSIDEARREEGRGPAPGGHGKEPRVQQQMVPLSYGSEMKPPSNTPVAPAEPDPKDNQDENKSYSSDSILSRIESYVRH